MQPLLAMSKCRFVQSCEEIDILLCSNHQPCPWKLSFRGTEVVAEVAGSNSSRSAKYQGWFLSLPDFEDANRDNLSYHVPLSQDPAKAVGLKFVYHDRMDGADS